MPQPLEVSEAKAPASNLGARHASQDHSVFAGGGEMGALMRSFDWSTGPLGPPESWSAALQNTTRLILANSFPMLLWWGPDFIQLYNDAYSPVLGGKHPRAALGRPFRECWAEVFPILGPLAQTPFEGGPATWVEDIPLEVNRYGFLEETHFTIGYSAVPDPDAPRGIGGVLATVHEITHKVISDRRLATLRELGTRAFDARTPQEACGVAASTLASDSLDIAFALLYLVDETGETARLTGETGISDAPALCPQSVDLRGDSGDLWELGASHRRNESVVLSDLRSRAAELPPGRWPDPPQTAVTVPIPSSAAGQPAGFLVAGISPRLRCDDACRGFLELFSAQIATVLTNARAFEEERRRTEALAEIDRAKTVFFSNVSHEFRTPLTLMMGPLEEAMREEGDTVPVRRENLELAHRNSLRMLKLVNSLLDFSRIEAGRIQAAYEPVDLAALTAEIASVFRSTIERAGLTFTIDCPPLDQPVYVDREMWEKVVLNLISNAFKFTLQGSIEVSLRPAGHEVQLMVRDTGTGIAPADLPRVFERFYRVANSRGRSYEGSGIGLALVQELIRLNGGEVRVESEVDRGSAFMVSVPFGSAHLPRERIGATRTASSSIGSDAFLQEALHWFNQAPMQQAAGAASSDRKRARIVIADDNSDMRQYVQHLLAGAYQVTAVADGEAALEAIRRDPPDLVLTDVMMPKLDGVGLLRALRADQRTASIPVIMLSARAGEESRVEGASAGADDYLVKPFSARELVARVENHLALSRLRRDSGNRIRESEERFRSLATATFSTIYRMSPDWSEMRQLTGTGFLTATESSNRNWLQEYIVPEDHAMVLDAIRQAVRTRSMFALEHRVRLAGGGVGWTLSRAIPLFDDHGEITEWFGAAVDLTERRRYQENQARLAAIVDSADDAIISKDLNSIIRTWNQGAERMFGYTAEEAIGHSILMIIPPELQYEEDEILAKLKAGQRIEHFETVRTGKNGERIEVSITISPLHDESGRVTGASKVARDISDRRRIERLLMQSEKLSATGRMAASIAHEINNPLESLMNLIYLASQHAELGGKALEYLRTAEQELERVSHLARQTLGYYRDTSAPTAVHLHDLVRNVLTVYNSRIIATGIAVNLRFNDLQRIMASKGEMLQVFSNIIANAIDAMNRGGTLSIATSKAVSSRAEGLEVVIRDTGTGIRPENLAKIFDPFFTTKGELGTGIGLWVAKQLVETRGGQISVASSVEAQRSGTTITIFIPFAMPGEASAA